MARRRPRSAANRSNHVEPTFVTVDLGTFEAETLDVPIVGVAPEIVDMLNIADRRQAFVGRADAIATRQEQPARSILADGIAGSMWLWRPSDTGSDHRPSIPR